MSSWAQTAGTPNRSISGWIRGSSSASQHQVRWKASRFRNCNSISFRRLSILTLARFLPGYGSVRHPSRSVLAPSNGHPERSALFSTLPPPVTERGCGHRLLRDQSSATEHPAATETSGAGSAPTDPTCRPGRSSTKVNQGSTKSRRTCFSQIRGLNQRPKPSKPSAGVYP